MDSFPGQIKFYFLIKNRKFSISIMFFYSLIVLLMAFNESKCNLLKVSSELLRACREEINDIAISQMLPDQQPDKVSVSAARQVAPCALGLRWLAASVSRILVVQD